MATERLSFELKEFNTASLTAAYQAFGGTLSAPAVSVTFINEGNVDVYISIDASTDHMRVPGALFTPGVLEVYTYNKHNHQNEDRCVFAKGTQLSVKQVTGAGAGYIIANICTL